MHFLNPVWIKWNLFECELLLCMTFVHFVVLLAMSGPLQQGIVAPNCSKVSQLGPLNTYFMGRFSGMSTRQIIAVRVRPWAKTYGVLAFRRTGLDQLCFVTTKRHDRRQLEPQNETAIGTIATPQNCETSTSTKCKTKLPGRIELPTFCVLGKRDNPYTMEAHMMLKEPS